jgi:F-type H+-transporting ATPase subunit b
MGLEIKAFDLIFQIVNFGILFIILKKFLFSAFLKSVEKEQNQAKTTKEKIEEIDKKLSEIQEESEKSRVKAHEESQKFLEQAKVSAEKIREELRRKAQDESKEILDEARRDIGIQKTKIKEEIKNDLVRVVEASLQKLNINLSVKEKEKTVQEAISKLSDG